MSIFISATKSGWYPEILKPVVDSILANDSKGKVLDIGTGPGTLPKMLAKESSDLQISGIDISRTMIDEARRNASQKNIQFECQEVNMPLPYANELFDVVSLCSVLFLLDESTKTNLLNESVRILKPGGKMIILTPSGKKSILSAFIEVWSYRFSFYNFTFPVWKIATTRKARNWQMQNWLEKYTTENHLDYSKSLTFNNNATIEIITKHK